LTPFHIWNKVRGVDDLELINMHLARTPISGLRDLSNASGVPYGTLWNLKMKNTKNPRYQTFKPLAAYLKSRYQKKRRVA
jgi:hypothetical protein